MIGCHNPKGCVMQSTETVLGVLRERGRKSQPAWTPLMARKRRKTPVVCQPCHDAVDQFDYLCALAEGQKEKG